MNKLKFITLEIFILAIMLGLTILALKTYDGSGHTGIVQAIMWGG